jgi:hypothetical protein
MKIAERFFEEDGKIIHKRTFDNQPALDDAAALRSAGLGQTGENRLVGRVPMNIVADWLKEAGVRMDDPAAKDVIRRKMLSGDFDAFRVWQGTY